MSWEAVYRIHHLGGNLDLRDIPSAIGGDVTKRHGIILAKSIPAKKYNIKTGESVPEALRKCPDLVLVPPNYKLYQKSSKAFMNILKEYGPTIELYSIDEAFVDMTGTESLFGKTEDIANEIRERIYRELGFSVNIGISNNKVLAKMASDFKKPNLVHTLWQHEIKEKMWTLPVSDLFFVGRATARKLNGLGIKSIGELAQTDLSIIKSHLGKHGEVIWSFANGIDFSAVEPVPPPNKGYSHQKKLKTATNITREIFESACQVFDEMWDKVPIRHLGIHTSQVVTEETRQLNLFDDMDYEKQERLDRAVDDISKLSRLLVLALIIIFFIINLIHIRHLCKMLYVYSLILFGFYFI